MPRSASRALRAIARDIPPSLGNRGLADLLLGLSLLPNLRRQPRSIVLNAIRAHAEFAAPGALLAAVMERFYAWSPRSASIHSMSHAQASAFLASLRARRIVRYGGAPKPTAPLLCPTCKVPFRAHPSPAAPVVFGCGHSVCKECADAMQNCIPPVCLLCHEPIHTVVDNRALGEFAEQDWGSDSDLDSDRDSAAAPLKRQRMAVSPPLAAQLDVLAHAAGVFGDAAGRAAQANAAVLSDTAVCVGRFNLAVDRMLVQVEEYRQRWLTQVQLLSHDRQKDLGAQTDLLGVSAGQLTACVALGHAALVSGDDARVWEATQSATATARLLTVPTRLCTGTRSAVLCDLSAVLACLEEGTQLQQFEVHAVRSRVSGHGLAWFVRGEAARNVIQVTCMGSDGVLADWATLEDVDVGVTLNGAAAQVASAVFTEAGVVRLTYAVEEEGGEEVEVGVSLRGVKVPGGPWRAHNCCLPRGVYIGTLAISDAQNNSGLAISSDGSLMVVSNADTDQLSVYRTDDGSLVRCFGGPGAAAGEFDTPRGLCMTTHDTILAADMGNERIQEITLEGAHVRSIAVDGVPREVAVHGDVVAVGTYDSTIRLYSCTTGALIKAIPSTEEDRLWAGMCFTSDGKHLMLSQYDDRITVLSVDDGSVTHINPEGLWMAVAFACTGDVVGLGRDQLAVFSATDGTVLQEWETADGDPAEFTGGNALAISRNRIYVLDRNTARVLVFE